VYDGVGSATIDRSLAALRPRGVLVLYGAAGEQPVEVARLNTGSTFPTRPTLVHYVATARICSCARATCAAGSPTGRSMTASAPPIRSRTRAAQEDLESPRTTGKLLFAVDRV
jgi:NADPH2:quinone reductase